MADILKIFLLVVGGVLVFIAFWLAAEALFPALVERARGQYGRPWRLTFAGLAMAAPFVAIAMLLFQKGNNPLLNIVGFIFLAVVLFGGLAGSAGLAKRIGLGLPAPIDEAEPWRRVLRGGTVLTLTFLLPFIGWIGLTIWTLVSGFAALVFAVREAQRAAPVPPAASAPPNVQVVA
jgi:succinate dehydrogenase/fumarate reductase cytochrome b subunit